MDAISLNDPSAFCLISGLWKGLREPLQPASVLRSTNFRGDGSLDYSDIAEMEVESRYFEDRRLRNGDILIERSGGGPKQPVGRVAYFTAPDGRSYFTSNFTTALRVVDEKQFEPRFVELYLQALYLAGTTEALQRATTGIRNLDWQEYLKIRVPTLPIEQQQRIAETIGGVRCAYRVEDAIIDALSDLKRVTMSTLFSRGLRAESQRESEVGDIPESWNVSTIGAHFSVSSGGTPSRSEPEHWIGGTIPWVKTGEVNYCIIQATQESITSVALKRSAAKLLPAGTLLLAMYGQGITRGKVAILGIEAACNQACAAIQPNGKAVNLRFLYHYLSARYEEIRNLAHGGQQQNINLDIVRTLQVAFPPELESQEEIVSVLDAIDRKSDLHRRKRAVLNDLFKSLLHKLMTGEIRVADLDLSALKATSTPEAVA